MDNRTLTSLLVVGIFVILVSFRRWRARKSLPPGPPRDPLIGHLRIIPQEKQAEAFHEWAKTYGDVMYLEVLGRRIVVLDTIKASRALLEDRGTNYSCRSRFVVWELMGWTRALALLPYGKQFFKHRKLLQTFFGKKETLAFNHILTQEARLLVKNFHEAGRGDLLKYVHRLTVSNIIRVTYGHQVKSDDDLFMKISNDSTHISHNSGPMGSTPIDFFPLLCHLPRWFPGTHYATLARSWCNAVRELRDAPVEFVRAGMKEKTVERSFVSDKLEELEGLTDERSDPDALTHEDITGAASAILSAGQETSYTALIAFVLEMVRNPAIQERAYEEIIAVVGQNRLPELSDRQSLPYLECILQENFRWHVSVPLGIPHRTLEDDVFNGMFIPKDTIVISNIRGMSRDERVYSDPLKFDPSRYLPAPEGKAEPRFSAMWGFGRRICPGRYFAELTIWHAMACVLATLEILPPKDEWGNVVLPDPVITEGVTSSFVPFNFEVRVRSEKAETLIAAIE
ncbi:cytochrome P450 [Marasmius fiardii PR-910]|nr:cytochrome P450 [Marasmius fiardii PR-910]